MVATILLCVISTFAFCACARGLIAVGALGEMVNHRRLSVAAFSSRARRVAKGYFTFTLAILMAVSFAGMVTSFLELFSYQL